MANNSLIVSIFHITFAVMAGLLAVGAAMEFFDNDLIIYATGLITFYIAWKVIKRKRRQNKNS